MKKFFNITIYVFAVIGFVLTAGFFAVKYGFTNTKGIIDIQRENFLDSGKISNPTTTENLYWENLAEWQTLKAAIEKDIPIIQKASDDAGVSSRLIVSALMVEQLRFFYTEREVYKKVFEPLKILGSETQFSWGVMGVKEETAIQIEENLASSTSPFFLDSEHEHILDFKTSDVKQERFERMTDEHNHYYSYLYAGLYMKEVMSQWQKAGYDISKRPDLILTLYNIGFANSKPNSDPHSGGAEIKIYDQTYSFGSLASEFYYSNEFLKEFPK